ncbi:hypothetical protein BHM03_00026514 [Ensete ventricosum]|nr:hypothetical protein BHM03_00026514 [Ensete ventricosum]
MMNVLFTFSFLDRRSMSSLLGFRNLMTERRRHNQTRFVASQEGSQYGPRRDKISDGSLLSFRGLKRSARRGKIDAYSAMVCHMYFLKDDILTLCLVQIVHCLRCFRWCWRDISLCQV